MKSTGQVGLVPQETHIELDSSGGRGLYIKVIRALARNL